MSPIVLELNKNLEHVLFLLTRKVTLCGYSGKDKIVLMIFPDFL